MGQEKYLDPSGILWERLAGRKIILAGISGRQKESFWQSLTYKSSQMGGAFEVSDDLEKAGERDCVLLFGGTERIEASGALLEHLKILASKKIASAVLLSDARVYGKMFGTEHPVKEDETGYVSHTSGEEQAAFAMRLAENLAYRLAQAGVPIRIARMEAEQDGIQEETLEAVLGILVCGIPGEVYNLPARQEKEEEKEGRSPLSPMRIVMDTSKFETVNIHEESMDNYVAEGLFE